MKFLLAPTAMKGALSPQKIASILTKTLRRRYRDAEIVSLPLADGGNGTLDCVMNALGGTIDEIEVSGPLPSQRSITRYGITTDRIAVIESAEVVGLHRISPSPETIAHATTRGIGELLRHLATFSPKEIWIGLGGTATNDGGTGMASALGAEFRDENGELLADGAIPLQRLASVLNDREGGMRIPVTILSDVRNPLLGPEGATYTFARQKGADEEQLPYLEAGMKNLAETVHRDLGVDRSAEEGSGAAGGLGYGLLTFTNATIVSGIETILSISEFDKHLSECDRVITTEGMLDDQTSFGKGIAGIAARAAQYNKPVHAFVGRIAGDAERLKSALGLVSLTAVSPEEMNTLDAMRDASWLLADAVYHHSF